MSIDETFATDPTVREAYSEDASGLVGLPDAVARPTSASEVADIVRWCAAGGTPLTPQGLRSSTVGSPLAMGGLALSLEKMDRLIDIDPVNRTATAEPGIVLATFKQILRQAGLFFPPDPTSENECTLGGAVMTNASGARTYAYGPIRPWVKSLDLVLGDGRTTTIERSETTKNTVGYFGFQNPIDLMIGSEGTLGVVTRVTVKLLPMPEGYLCGMAFLPDMASAVRFVMAADGRRGAAGAVRPRCLELFDDGSLELIRPIAGALRVPPGAGAGIYFEEECAPDEAEAVMARWLGLIDACNGFADDTIVAINEAQEKELRRLRHALPATMNERGREARRTGGLKLGTDWAVPLPRLPEMIEEATRIARESFGGFFIRYGHIGNGHPHFNMLAGDPESLTRARRAAHEMCLKAVSLGGTVTAEHGVGKLKRDYVPLQYPGWVLEAMKSLKRSLDPAGILAPGNIF